MIFFDQALETPKQADPAIDPPKHAVQTHNTDLAESVDNWIQL